MSSPDELRLAAVVRFDRRVTDLDFVANEVIKLLAESVERFKTQLFDGLGYKGLGLSKDDVTSLTKLTAAFNSATDAQIRLDKTAKDRVKRMTHDEHKAAMADWLMRLPTAERSKWILALVDRHDEAKLSGQVLASSKRLDGVREELDQPYDPVTPPRDHAI